MTREFFQLDPKLQTIVCDIIRWGVVNGEEPTFTCFMRTEEEQAALLKSGEAEGKISVHQFGRGADFRLFENSILNYIVGNYLNEKYPYGDGVHKTHLLHQGTAMHHHVQCMETKKES